MWFALEEKNIPYDTVLINLQDKPEWFKKMVPTQLVPAIKLNGELVYESYDIMMVGTADHICYHSYPILAAVACLAAPHSKSAHHFALQRHPQSYSLAGE